MIAALAEAALPGVVSLPPAPPPQPTPISRPCPVVPQPDRPHSALVAEAVIAPSPSLPTVEAAVEQAASLSRALAENQQQVSVAITTTSTPPAAAAAVDDRRLDCMHCGKRFKRVGHRREHERTHTGEKPYGCTYCGKRFSRSSHVSQRKRRNPPQKTPLRTI